MRISPFNIIIMISFLISCSQEEKPWATKNQANENLKRQDAPATEDPSIEGEEAAQGEQIEGVPEDGPLKPEEVETESSPLDEAMTYWRSFAPHCTDFPAKEDCDDGDATLFNGLLCWSGEDTGCAAVKNAQGADGRLWRSPRRVDGNLGEKNSFSRDMAIGVLFYLLKSEDRALAKTWLDWIEENRPCAIEKADGSCAIWGLHRLCRDDSDNRCTITPNLWAVMARIYRYLGLPLNTPMQNYLGIDTSTIVEETKSVDLGYELHLKSLLILIRKSLDELTDEDANALNLLIDRQPENLFFRYVKHGPSHNLINFVIELCPKIAGDQDFRKHQWSWERKTESQPWLESMGWDCIFMGNLLTSLPTPAKSFLKRHRNDLDTHFFGINAKLDFKQVGVFSTALN